MNTDLDVFKMHQKPFTMFELSNETSARELSPRIIQVGHCQTSTVSRGNSLLILVSIWGTIILYYQIFPQSPMKS